MTVSDAATSETPRSPYDDVLVEIDDDVLRFQTLSRAGKKVDEGEIRRSTAPSPAELKDTAQNQPVG